jgi:excisionase family DNA binding protein
MQPVFTPDQVAERWGCSAETVRTMCRAGRLRYLRLGGGRGLFRIPAEAVLAVEQCERQTTGSDGSSDDMSLVGGRTASEGVIVLTHSRPRGRPD